MIPGSSSAEFFGAAGAAGGGAYEVPRSLRFNSADSAFLSRTPASAGNRKTWTWAGWVKRSEISANHVLLGAFPGSGNYSLIQFLADNRLRVLNVVAGNIVSNRVTTRVFRDPSAWYHLVVSSNSSTSLKVYINGVEETAFDITTGPDSSDWSFNNNSEQTIGQNSVAGGSYFNGYLADLHLIDGQALTPTSFGEFDANGVWQPKAYSGSYGTNGFHLDFADNSSAAALGYDAAGSNDWTVNNISVNAGTPVSIASATGALPIYNTTDTYGEVKGSGTRADSNSSSIVLAIPMDGANNGTTFTDESATIKGSGSPKTITRAGDTSTKTAVSKFYGSSAFFDGTGDYLELADSDDWSFGSGDFTIEAWVHVTAYGGDAVVVAQYGSDSNNSLNSFFLAVNNGFPVFYYYGTSNETIGAGQIPLYRWTHLAVSRSGSTLRFFVDGVVAASQSTSNTLNNPSTNLRIGNAVTNNYPFTGYLQDVRIYKGAAKYTAAFIPPVNPQQAAVVGAGNDSLRDSPTNGSQTDTGVGGEVVGNYATWNPLDCSSGSTFANGNLDVANNANTRATISVPLGAKIYFECQFTSSISKIVGFAKPNTAVPSYPGAVGDSYGYQGDGYFYASTGTVSTTSSAINDVIMVAIDRNSHKIWFGKNGTWFGSGDPATGANAAFSSIYSSGDLAPTCGWTGNLTANFGQRPFAYTAPSGFKALCTTNLPAPTIADGSTVMDVKLYTGNGSTQTISGLGLSPDFLWIKDRTSAVSNRLFDQVRGASAALFSNLTNAENTTFLELDSFNSDGFSVATTNGTGTNANGDAYVAWAWDAGSTTVTNTQGSITSQVRANASAGFSIVTLTTSSSAGTYTAGHGLGVAPAMFITKRRSGTSSWWTYHSALGHTQYLNLSSTAAAASDYGWGAAPTSSVFTFTSDFLSASSDYVVYCFAPVAGYSAFGSYTGNGSSTDGPFVYTGFKPRFLLIKGSSVANTDWAIIDTARDTYNIATDYLAANSSGAEQTLNLLDVVSNGFKIKAYTDSTNQNNQTYVWAAFAEHPFALARAR